jgi:hypothetical protein
MVSILILMLTKLFYLIPQPLLPGEKGSKEKIIIILSPSPLGEGFRKRWISKN